MKRRILLTVAVCALIISASLTSLTSCVKGDEDEGVHNYVEVGDRVPEFVVSDIEGNRFDSRYLAGRHSLIMFFDIECSYCREELPKIEQLWQTMKDDPDFRLVPIERSRTSYQNMKIPQYWSANGFTMPYYQDEEREVYEKFANNTIPRFYIVGPSMEIAWMNVGAIDDRITVEHLAEMIRDAE